jgi:hypothetical protein
LSANAVTSPNVDRRHASDDVADGSGSSKREGDEDPQTLGEHIATLVLQPLLNPVPVLDTEAT